MKKKICLICQKEYKPNAWQTVKTCSRKCTQIMNGASYYDIDGSLKISESGLKILLEFKK